MTILHGVKQKVSGVPVWGHQISCASDACNHCSAFFPDTKHLPHDVVEKKFQQMGWEVNSNGKDYCPHCIARRRAPRAKKQGQAGAADKSIVIETEHASASNLRKIIAGKGLFPTDCIELEHRQKKFKITFRNVPEIHIGVLTNIEGDILTKFNAALVGSSLRYDLQHVVEKSTHTLQIVIHWYLTLEIVQQRANYPVTPIPHHLHRATSVAAE